MIPVFVTGDRPGGLLPLLLLRVSCTSDKSVERDLFRDAFPDPPQAAIACRRSATGSQHTTPQRGKAISNSATQPRHHGDPLLV